MNNPLLNILQGEMPQRRPVWLMRQAGRYLPEYRRVRERAGSFLDLCYDPEMAAEVTLQPLRLYDLDAAILFADILVVPHAMGVDVRFAEGEGPILSRICSSEDVSRLGQVSGSRQSAAVCETVERVRRGLGSSQALIGFCGAPWTVASYMVEGGSSERLNAKRHALLRTGWFLDLIDRLVVESVEYLSAQIQAGAQVVQVFDSWAGELLGETGTRFVIEPISRMVAELTLRHPDVPVIVFAKGMGVRQPEVAEVTGAAAVGLEAELPMGWASANIRDDVCLQGNLDPAVLLSDREVVVRETLEVLQSVPMRRHVFNLGHGIKVGTDPELVGAIVDTVRSFDRVESHG